MVEGDYIKVICPWCGKEMDLPYVYDGTYEICHSYCFVACTNSKKYKQKRQSSICDIQVS